MGSNFSFDTASLEPVVAHGGTEILFARVVDRLPNPGCIFVDLSVVPAGGRIGLHTHGPDDEEIYVIVDGEGFMTVDDRRVPVASGDVVVNRPSGSHSLENTGSTPLRLVIIDVGAGGRTPELATQPD